MSDSTTTTIQQVLSVTGYYTYPERINLQSGHTTKASALMSAVNSKSMSMTSYLESTFAVLVHQEKADEELQHLAGPLVLCIEESFENLKTELQGILMMDEKVRALRVEWDGKGPMRLNEVNLGTALRLLHQRGGRDLLVVN